MEKGNGTEKKTGSATSAIGGLKPRTAAMDGKKVGSGSNSDASGERDSNANAGSGNSSTVGRSDSTANAGSGKTGASGDGGEELNINVSEELKKLKTALSNSDDILTKEFELCGKKVAIVHMDNMINKELLERNIIMPLMSAELKPPYKQTIANTVYFAEEITGAKDAEAAARKVAAGDTVFLIDGADEYYIFSLRQIEKRAVTEPPTSSVLKGPRDGFIEDIKTNISLIRRRLRHPHLVVENIQTGRYSNTAVSIVYLGGVADPNVVEKVRERINNIDTDGILDSSYIVQYLEERKYSLFGGAGSSEKPDIVAAKILEGRVAVVADGSPMVVTVPFVLLEDFQDSNDYYAKDISSSVFRVLRLLSAIMTVMLPGLYVAFTTYMYHLLPIKFLITLINSVNGIPFTPPVEMLLVLLLFEILNQASLRMPRFLGISLSIVGAIVLGETAVKAGLISSPAVLISALSGIGLFCVPSQVNSFTVLRILYVFVASILGLFGVILCSMALLTYLINFTSYGAPYLAPYAPVIMPDLKDGFLKANQQLQNTRPYSFPNRNRHRQSTIGTE
ncbi:MAG: spore germination protein [Clostridiaceae bacterium]|jgi:spore germination protein KA|nr:spore germination protein [Clostridiaceae bacterium]